MAGITVSGITSGLDVNQIVDDLVAAEGDPPTARLDFRELETEAEVSAMASLKSGLSAFRDAASPLSYASTFQSVSINSSDTDSVSATGSSIAKVGTHVVEVSQLAQAHGLASKALPSVTDSVGQGTLNFRFGTYDSSGNTFTANENKTAQSIVIDSANDSLQGIREAVNGAGIGVQASIVNDGSGYRLVFRSDDTGAVNGLEITVSGDGDGQNLDDAGLSQLAYDPTAAGVGSGKNLSQTVAAQDANFSVDGIAITKSSNTTTDVIEGVTLTLAATTTGATTLNVQRDTSTLRSSIDAFIGAFNDLSGIVNELGDYDADGGTAGILTGDSMLRNLEMQLRSTIGSPGVGLTGTVQTLADIGITTAADGSLSISDEASLSSALANDPEAVAALFSVVGRNDDPLINFISSTDNSKAGNYGVVVSTLATQGDYRSGTVTSFVVNADNDQFSLTVDGAQSATISLTQQTYASGAALAAEIQAKINADAVFNAAGARVSVEYAGGTFQIRSQSFGSNSSVTVTSADTNAGATLGISTSTGTSTTGIDVAGTIGGVTAIGAGRVLTGTGDASGLAIEVLGGATGSRVGISFARGFADTLIDTLDAYLADDGTHTEREDSLNARLEGIAEDRESLETRLDSLEERLRAEFTALELVLAQLQTTSDFLTQQLNALSNTGDT